MLNIVYIGFLINLKYVTTPPSAIRLPPPLTRGRLFLVHDTVSVSTSVGASALHRCPPDTLSLIHIYVILGRKKKAE